MRKKTAKNKDQVKEVGSMISEAWLRQQLPLTYAKLILLIKSLDECEKENHLIMLDNITFNSFMFDVMEKGKLLDYVTNNINIEKVNYDNRTFGWYWHMTVTMKPQEKNILRYLAVTCLLLPEWFKSLNLNKEDKFSEDRFSEELILIQKGYEAIGYWTAKLEENMRNRKSVKPRTDKKAERKNDLREWIKTMKPNEYRLKAQKEWGVVDRTVLLYEQELREENKAQDTTDILKLVTPEMEQEIRQWIQSWDIARKKRLEEIKRNPKIIEIMDQKKDSEISAFLRKYNDMT